MRFLVWIVLMGAILFFCTHFAIAIGAVIVVCIACLAFFNGSKPTPKKQEKVNPRPNKPKYSTSSQYAIRQQLESVLIESRGVLELEKLLTILEVQKGQEKTLPKRTLDQIITCLSGFGYGLVPNYQLGHRRLNYGDVCVVYKFPLSLYNLKASRMRRKEIFFKLLSMVFSGDSLSYADVDYVKRCVCELGLADEFQGHFYAYTLWLSQRKLTFDKNTKDAIALMPVTHKQFYAKLLLNSVYANGEIDNKRVETLKKILPFLGFDANSIHSLLHQTLTDESGFAPVEQNNVRAQEPYSLDMGKLNELKEQTKAAQDLLYDIFVEEEEAPKPNIEQKENSIIEVLTKLLEKEVWTRDEIKDLVGPNVMIGNLLEEINDYSYSKVDDIVVEEDGNQIYVTIDYKNQLI